MGQNSSVQMLSVRSKTVYFPDIGRYDKPVRKHSSYPIRYGRYDKDKGIALLNAPSVSINDAIANISGFAKARHSGGQIAQDPWVFFLICICDLLHDCPSYSISNTKTKKKKIGTHGMRIRIYLFLLAQFFIFVILPYPECFKIRHHKVNNRHYISLLDSVRKKKFSYRFLAFVQFE